MLVYYTVYCAYYIIDGVYDIIYDIQYILCSIQYRVYSIQYICEYDYGQDPTPDAQQTDACSKGFACPSPPAGGADTSVSSQEGVRTSLPNCKRTGATHLNKQLCLLSIRGLGHVILYVIYFKKQHIFFRGTLYISHIAYRIQYVVCSVQYTAHSYQHTIMYIQCMLDSPY